MFIYRKGNIIQDFLNFFKIILFGKYDVIHVFEPFLPTYPILILLLRLKRSKTIYDSGDIHQLNGKLSGLPYISLKYMKLNEFLAYNLSDTIIVRGGCAKEIISNYFGLPLKKIKFIPDGVDLSRFDSRNSEEFKKSLGLSDKFVLGYSSSIRTLKIGTVDGARGWELLEIGKMMIESGRTNFKILIVGNGPGLSLLIKRATDYGLKEHILFTGFVSETDYPMYLRSMDAGFYESINHPAYIVMMPTKLIEYMASSLPIIAGNIGEAKRTFHNNGILYEPLEPDLSNLDKYLRGIFTACCKLYDDPSLAQNMGRKSRQIALEYYDWTRISQCYLDFLTLSFARR